MFNKSKIVKYTCSGIATVLLTLLSAYIIGLSDFNGSIDFSKIPLLILLLCMIPISIIDIKLRIIPDYFSYSLIVLGLLSSFLPGNITPLLSLAGFLIGGGILFIVGLLGEYILKKESMGGGDIKLLAAIGAFMGPFNIFPILFFASLSALVSLIPLKLKGEDIRGKAVPFGPFLALGLFFTLIFSFYFPRSTLFFIF